MSGEHNYAVFVLSGVNSEWIQQGLFVLSGLNSEWTRALFVLSGVNMNGKKQVLFVLFGVNSERTQQTFVVLSGVNSQWTVKTSTFCPVRFQHAIHGENKHFLSCLVQTVNEHTKHTYCFTIKRKQWINKKKQALFVSWRISLEELPISLQAYWKCCWRFPRQSTDTDRATGESRDVSGEWRSLASDAVWRC